LIERPATTGVPDSLLKASKRAWPGGVADYLLVNEQGEVINQYSVTVWSIDDELGSTLITVDGETLLQIVVRAMAGDEPTLSEQILLTGLKPADGTADRTLERVALQRLDDLAARRRQEGEARVAAIVGADDGSTGSESFRAAQRALRQNVASYGDPLSAELLAALVRFDELYNAAPIIEPALETFVAACRRAAFDRTLQGDTDAVHELSGLPWWTAKDIEAARKLVPVLRDLEAALDGAAEGQEIADAPRNARAFTAAARGVARSRKMLEAMLASGS
jgi:hypothetical protein